MKRTLTRDDIIPLSDFLKIRDQKRLEITALKRNRRLSVGPDIVFYFENYQTIWWQIHEMLRIEQGGDSQIDDELNAYASLVPKVHPDQSQDLVATMMIEIDDMVRRRRVLAQLGGIEETVSLRFGDTSINATPETEVDRTTADGKTSAVHFLHFILRPDEIRSFLTPNVDVILAIDHPNYSHKSLLPEGTRQSLGCDFDLHHQ